jgi:hypothetical protein
MTRPFTTRQAIDFANSMRSGKENSTLAKNACGEQLADRDNGAIGNEATDFAGPFALGLLDCQATRQFCR